MYKALYQTHKIVVLLFLLIYLIKTFLLLSNRKEKLSSFTRIFRVPEMIISTLFLLTGIYLIFQVPEIKSLLIIKLVAVAVSIPLAVVGFKKEKKALALISLLLIITAYGLAEMSKKQKSSAAGSLVITEQASAEDLFKAYCMSCHGEAGDLGTAGASDLSSSILDKTGTENVIRNGRGSMASFDTQLSSEQISALAEYVQSLKK